MTGRDVVSAALRKIGALAPSESLAASEATDGLAELNRMLGSWSSDGLLIFSITAEPAITLVGGQAMYTLGTGGDLANRPMKIKQAFIRDGNTDYPVRLISAEEYAELRQKTVQSTYPSMLYDDSGYPQRTIALYPTPDSSKSLMLYTERPLSIITTLDTVVSFPPTYEEAMIYNLAIRLAPEYGQAVPDAVATIASDSLAAIKRANHKPGYLKCDAALTRHGAFNIFTGDYTR